jgi:arylsulfatase A
VLQRNGYVTGAFGKWGLGPVGSSGDPNKQGFDKFFGYNCQSLAHSYYPEYLWDNDRKVRINPTPIPGHRKQPMGDVKAEEWIGQQYAPEVMIEQAQSFINDHRDEPFFLYLPFIEPHVAMHPPLSALENFPLDWDEQPYRGGNGYLPHPRPRAAYAAMIEELDRHVGKVLDALDQFGLTEDTLVVFTSDNGPTHPGNQDPAFHIGGADPNFFSSTLDLRGYKGSVYEGGIRVPMIARWPNHIPAGSEHDVPSYFADWFPTLCEIANVPELYEHRSDIFDALDGESLLPVLEGKVPEGTFQRNSPMVWVFPEYTGQVAVRWGGFKLVRRGLATASPMPWELYDLANDPGEGVNLSDAYPQLVEEGKSILASQSEPNIVFPVRFDGARDDGK